MFSFVQLRCFAAVAEDPNLRRAAKRLNMTQPPLTRHIQALEHQVGAALLDRTGRSVRLTPAGQAFARSARRLLQEAEVAAREAQRIASGDAGSLTVAFTAASSYAFLPGLVATIRARLPAISLTLRELATPEQVAALKAGEVDLCLLRPPLNLAGVETRLVHREPVVLAVPAGHALASAEAVHVSDLAGEVLITYPPVEGPYFHRLVTGLVHAAGVVPAGTQYITQTHSILALVGAGLGVAVVPQAAERFTPPSVAFRALGGAETVRAELILAWRSRSENPACLSVVELVAAA